MVTKGRHNFLSPLDEEHLAPKLPQVKLIVNCTINHHGAEIAVSDWSNGVQLNC